MERYESLHHTKWECKYHVVWIPKWRKRVLYGQLRKELGQILRGLAMRKESERILREKAREQCGLTRHA